ncbi:MAG: hypothetical protein N3D84_00185 [Candidatus Woesearchaeota archaeon]|nr:hypothetical protein [Candidatus Woesearchaeota archaeon]
MPIKKNIGPNIKSAAIKITFLSSAFIMAIILFIIAAGIANAQSGHMKLLAVSETSTGFNGSVVDLYLDIKPGSGRVFMDTFPAAKIDTQLSTRFAKDMACKYLNIDCSNLDFFYTIKANAPIIGGPSAGAAITVLTISLLGNMKFEDQTAITGTINSGYLIGPVGGIKEKIDAAKENGLKKVLVPLGERFVETENKTLDLVEYGDKIGIEVYEVGSIDDALYFYTGKKANATKMQLAVNEEYKSVMKDIGKKLCERSTMLKKELESFNMGNLSILTDKTSIEDKKKAENLTEEGLKAIDNEKYYSAASYCFGANVRFNSLILKTKNISVQDARDILESLSRNITQMEKNIEDIEIKTINDLQTYMIVKDRLDESKDYLNKSYEDLENKSANKSNLSEENIALAIERLNSAISWANFFGKNGQKFSLGEDELKVSCLNKISEAEEQYQYVDYLFKGLLDDVGREIQDAKEEYWKKDYIMCLYRAALAKAHIGVVSSSIGVKKEEVNIFFERKMEAAAKSIATQQQRGIFPILAYSYYEYGASLKERDIYSALLYEEYSLELSNLDIYFRPYKIKITRTSNDLMVFFSGMMIGIMLALLVIVISERKRRRGTYRPPLPHHKKLKFKFKHRAGL